MATAIPTQTEKCKGAMLATAIGDALGWPNEPRSRNRAKKPKTNDHFVEWTRSCSNPRWHDEKILPGEYSDDTQMTLSVSRSIIAGDWEKFFTEKELPFWLTYERGGGGALLKAAKSCNKKKVLLWQSNFTQGYFNAGGNGAAMRILPHVIAGAKTPDIHTLMLNAIKNTLITHGHPRAFLGATCYAYALEYLLRKENVLEYGELVTAVIDGQKIWGANPNPDVFGDWLDVARQHRDYEYATEWVNTRTHMVKQLEYIRDSLKKGLMLDDTKVLTELECFGKVNGAGDVAALAAIYLASRYANNPSLGIKVPAFSFGADTDTIASITGGLLGMLSGMNWIPPEWRVVQDYNCLIQMTELLLADNKKEATKAEVSEAKTQDGDWRNSPIGKIQLVDSKNVPNGKYGIVIIRKWQTALGQTLYTKEAELYDNGPQSNDQTTLYDFAAHSPSKTKAIWSQMPSTAPVQKSIPQNVALSKLKRQFVLDGDSIAALLGNPQFKKKITVGKMLKIVRALIESDEASDILAKQFEVEQSIVDLLKAYVIE
ncbi:ADP-ribosylglycohydrolase family protein [Desulfitobacterium hafniense]|nr:ADP-ribosylglycohydrolase family protein [Desulfitobacterium hafniense]